MASWKLRKWTVPDLALTGAIYGMAIFFAGFVMIDRPANTVSDQADAAAHTLMMVGMGTMAVTLIPVFVWATAVAVFSAFFEKAK